MQLTPEAANRKEAWLRCRYCDQPVAASSHEQRAEAAVAALAAATGCRMVTESKLLGQTFGATDLAFEVQRPAGKCWVGVEVDGESHTIRPDGRSSQQERQRQDMEKDTAAWGERSPAVPIVRLHHADQAEWEHALLAAWSYAHRYLTFIIYTSSYTAHHCSSQGMTTAGEHVSLNQWHQVGSPSNA